MSTRPETPDDALKVTTYKPGEQVYYALPGDREWKVGTIIKKESSENSAKYKVRNGSEEIPCEVQDLRKMIGDD